jgi:hypothetical protein
VSSEKSSALHRTVVRVRPLCLSFARMLSSKLGRTRLDVVFASIVRPRRRRKPQVDSAELILDEANVRHLFYRVLGKGKLRRIVFTICDTRSPRCSFSTAKAWRTCGNKWATDRCGRHLRAAWWPVATVRRSIVLTHATICNPRATRSGCGGSGPDAKCCGISGEPNRNRTRPWPAGVDGLQIRSERHASGGRIGLLEDTAAFSATLSHSSSLSIT